MECPQETTDLIQTPPLIERSHWSSALKVVMLNIAISIAYPRVSFVLQTSLLAKSLPGRQISRWVPVSGSRQ